MMSKKRRKSSQEWEYYWDLGLNAIKELETADGILASGRNEAYGAIFGRDSLITSLKLLGVYRQTGMVDLLTLVRKVLITLIDLQGSGFNINSGEEPGKIIHEYRTERYQHLTEELEKPWYLYPDKIMRNYDSVDATPLFLITLYRYQQVLKKEGKVDFELNAKTELAVTDALEWILNYGDSDGDGFIDYMLHPKRSFGGLVNQNWMDSVESTFHEDGTPVTYPIAPVEAQAYVYLALKLWSKYFRLKDPQKAQLLTKRAASLKTVFNERFVSRDENGVYLASGIDGSGKRFCSVRSSMGHCLWAATNLSLDQESDSILEPKIVGKIVARLMAPDLFVAEAGIRTLSATSVNFEPNSYHNGSIWPHDSNMIAEGMENFGYYREAKQIRQAVLSAIRHFQTPLELFVYDKGLQDYISDHGQTSCKKQAWAAAAILSSALSSKTDGEVWFRMLSISLLTDNLVRPLNATNRLTKKYLFTSVGRVRDLPLELTALSVLNVRRLRSRLKKFTFKGN